MREKPRIQFAAGQSVDVWKQSSCVIGTAVKPKNVIRNNRKEVTEKLSRLLEDHLNPRNDPRIYTAREVTFGYGTPEHIRVDYMLFKPENNSRSGIEHGDFYCYEVKSSVEDFKSPNGHNMIGDYNYYVMSREVFDAVENMVPYKIGVLIPEPESFDATATRLTSVKRAKRCNRQYALSEMLFAMFRSANREKHYLGGACAGACEPLSDEKHKENFSWE